MSLSAASLLNAWEMGLAQPLAARVLGLLEAASAGESRDQLARLPIGERDARLFAVRESAFGSRLECVVACPACGETLEFSLDAADLRAARAGAAPGALEIREGGYEIRFRLPDSGDVEALESCPDADSGRRLLLERCLVEVRRAGATLVPAKLPDELVAAISEAMERADPQANVELALGCPQCRHRWQSPFDVASYLWAETEGWARRMLREVHALAAAYGWTESEILRVSARRRALYLDLIGR